VKSPTVSVLVPTFNRAHYLSQALDSLLAQTVAPQQLVVVDDGSSDDTRLVIERFGSRVQMAHQANAGKASAVNLGLTLCDGDLVWLFDDDDVALPDAIEKRLAVLAANPEADFVYSAHHVGVDNHEGELVRETLYIPEVPQPESFFLEIMRSCFFHLNSALVPRRFYRDLGGMDTKLLRAQDYDFQIRLARVARPVLCRSPSFVFRRHQGDRGSHQMRHSADERASVFRAYSSQLGTKLRSTLALGEYLVPPSTNEPEGQRRQSALLNRLSVMANHGCVGPYLEDLEALVRAEAAQPFDSFALHSIACSYQRGWMREASEREWPAFVAAMRRLSDSKRGRSAVRAVCRGLFGLASGFPGRPATRARQAGHALQLALTSLR
jgi:hypothetical protein